ncbi:unnamed protein product [Anisakis simplex]|uniref:Uncharacterized protein n=1 Tax=Anisakis simplex TaxID=6269 RepID=A0A3P6S2J4_ANISI|nr:unnamed protein product [Anisakis simplex]
MNSIRSDVRSKAAMFDDVAMRYGQQAGNDVQAMMGSRYRSRSAPRSESPNMYIPQPDYNDYEPISVDTSSAQNNNNNDTNRYFGFRSTDDFANSTTMSPSERRLRKFEVVV